MWLSAAPRPPAGRTTASGFPTLARRMLTGMVRETHATMILTMTEFRILLTTAHWSPTSTREIAMVTQKAMPATTALALKTHFKRMLMEMARVTLVMMILMVMDD